MKEQLISLKTATLAKEKQFQEYTSYFYTKENGLCSIDNDGETLNIYNDDLTFKDSIWDCNGDFWYNEIEDEEGIYAQTYEPIKYPAPTQGLLQKWLRDREENIIIVIPMRAVHRNYNGWYYEVFTQLTKKDNPVLIIYSNENFDTYEEALEKGLQEALKLI